MHWFWRAAIALALAYGWMAMIGLPGGSPGSWRRRVYFRSDDLLFVACVTGPMVAVFIYAAMTYHDHRKLDGRLDTRCRACGYILRGLTEPRCPECGERI